MIKTMNWRQLFLGAALVTAVSGTAGADDFHNKNLLVGDRAVGLGGAYAAISDDPSGMFYNPAGIVTARDLSSASVNVYSRSSTSYKNFFADGRSFTDTSSTIVPSFFGILRHYSFGTLGLSVAVPDYVSESQTNSGDYSETVTFKPAGGTAFSSLAKGTSKFSTDIDQAAYQLGLSFATQVNERLSAGMSLYGTYHNSRDSREVSDTFNVDDPANSFSSNLVTFSSYRTTQSVFGIMPKIGLKAVLLPGFTLGMVAAKEYAISRSYEVNKLNSFSGNYTYQGNTQPFNNLPTIDQSNSSALRHYPWQLTASGTYQVTPTVMALLQLDYFSYAIGDTTGDIDDGTFRQRGLLNWTVGGEWQIQPSLSLRMAAYSSRSNLSNVVVNSLERQDAVNLYGGAFGATYRTPAHIYQAGVYATVGNGYGNPGSLNPGESNLGFSYRLDAINQTNFSAYFGVTL